MSIEMRSKSLPVARSASMLNGVPSLRFIDDTNIQILIHRQEPEEEILYHYADSTIGKWRLARSVYIDFPKLLRIPLTASGDTALHVAVSANNSDFVEGLVSLESMTPEVLEIPNVDGNTAFCIAVIIGNVDFLKIMLAKNQNLPLIHGYGGMLPVHLAALSCDLRIVKYLSIDNDINLLQMMKFKDVKQLFFMTINSGMYDVANILVENYPEHLVVARDDKLLTALHILAQKSPEESADMREMNKETASSSVGVLQMVLLETLWDYIKRLEPSLVLKLITHPSVALFDAVKSGNEEIVIWLISKSRELLTIKDPKNGQNLLQFAVLHRKGTIFEFILGRGTANLIKLAVDNNRNNVLHFAARKKVKTPSSLRPSIQMHEDLAWFKEVERKVPDVLRTMRNSKGKTPKDIFYANRKKLSNVVKEETKEIARSTMVVATLVAGVAFAAALKVPADVDKSSVASVVFILANAAALFTSAASIISFLSIFIFSRFTKIEFMISLHPSLIIGLTLLLTSIITMIIAFGAAGFLIFDNVYKWVPCAAASMAIIPLLAFGQLRLTICRDIRDYRFLSKYSLTDCFYKIKSLCLLSVYSVRNYFKKKLLFLYRLKSH